MHDRHDLTDGEWARLEPLLPAISTGGSNRAGQEVGEDFCWVRWSRIGRGRVVEELGPAPRDPRCRGTRVKGRALAGRRVSGMAGVCSRGCPGKFVNARKMDCLDVNARAIRHNAPVVRWGCHTGSNQSFSVAAEALDG